MKLDSRVGMGDEKYRIQGVIPLKEIVVLGMRNRLLLWW